MLTLSLVQLRFLSPTRRIAEYMCIYYVQKVLSQAHACRGTKRKGGREGGRERD